jgi:hypothetical protein
VTTSPVRHKLRTWYTSIADEQWTGQENRGFFEMIGARLFLIWCPTFRHINDSRIRLAVPDFFWRPAGASINRD